MTTCCLAEKVLTNSLRDCRNSKPIATIPLLIDGSHRCVVRFSVDIEFCHRGSDFRNFSSITAVWAAAFGECLTHAVRAGKYSLSARALPIRAYAYCLLRSPAEAAWYPFLLFDLYARCHLIEELRHPCKIAQFLCIRNCVVSPTVLRELCK